MKQIWIVLIVFAAGCLVTHSNDEKITGKYIPENTFARIQPGKTTVGWVKATLGDPSEKTQVEGSPSEIWKYNYTERKESSGAVFLIFGGSSNKEKNGTAYVEIKDGIVTNKWRG